MCVVDIPEIIAAYEHGITAFIDLLWGLGGNKGEEFNYARGKVMPEEGETTGSLGTLSLPHTPDHHPCQPVMTRQ